MKISFVGKHIAINLLRDLQPGQGDDPLTVLRRKRPKCHAALDAFTEEWNGREVFPETPGKLSVHVILDHDGSSEPLLRQKTAGTGNGYIATLLMQRGDLFGFGREDETDEIRDSLEARMETILEEVEGMLGRRKARGS